MSHFKPVQLKHACRLLNHGPTVLVTSHDPENNKRNVMAAAWNMPVNFNPSQVAIVVDKAAWTWELIAKGGAFGICIATASIADLTYTVGSTTGRDGDKFDRFDIPSINSPNLGVPIIEEGCAAWLECRLLPEAGASERFDTLFGEVIYAAADACVFSNGHWTFDETNTSMRTLHYLGDGNFLTIGGAVKANML